jgi:hypothetical protein
VLKSGCKIEELANKTAERSETSVGDKSGDCMANYAHDSFRKRDP